MTQFLSVPPREAREAWGMATWEYGMETLQIGVEFGALWMQHLSTASVTTGKEVTKVSRKSTVCT